MYCTFSLLKTNIFSYHNNFKSKFCAKHMEENNFIYSPTGSGKGALNTCTAHTDFSAFYFSVRFTGYSSYYRVDVGSHGTVEPTQFSRALHFAFIHSRHQAKMHSLTNKL